MGSGFGIRIATKIVIIEFTLHLNEGRIIQGNTMLGMKQHNEKQNKRKTIEFLQIINKTLLNHSELQIHDAEKVCRLLIM